MKTKKTLLAPALIKVQTGFNPEVTSFLYSSEHQARSAWGLKLVMWPAIPNKKGFYEVPVEEKVGPLRKSGFRKAFCIGKFLACTAGLLPGEWDITHILTGYKIHHGNLTYRLAGKLCKQFEAWGPEYWDFDDSNKIPEKLLKRSGEIRSEIENQRVT